MYEYRRTFISKHMLLVFVLCLFGAALPFNSSFGQVSSAVEQLKLAGSADARALFTEAKKYHDGDGVAQDLSKARLLYLKAAGMGHNDSRINLGYLYFMGQGVEQDYLKAYNWYLSAAKNGDKSAQKNLAMMYEHGLGVEKDPKQVKYWREFGAVKPVAELQIKPVTNIVQVDEVVPEVVPEIMSEVVPKIVPKIVPEIVPEIMSEVVSEIAPLQDAKPVNSADNKSIMSQLKTPTMIAAGGDLRGYNFLLKNIFAKKPDLPIWASNLLVGFMLLLALITGAWFIVQYKKLAEQKKAYLFAKAFYAHHRDQLRVNYLRYPPQNRKHGRIDDLWAGTLCVLMVRFAQKQKDAQSLVGEQSRKIMKAMAQTTLKAKQSVFPLVATIQQKIFSDIQAHDFKPQSQLTPQLVRHSKAKTPTKPRISAAAFASNVVSFNAERNKHTPYIPPESLWPDTPRV